MSCTLCADRNLNEQSLKRAMEKFSINLAQIHPTRFDAKGSFVEVMSWIFGVSMEDFELRILQYMDENVEQTDQMSFDEFSVSSFAGQRIAKVFIGSSWFHAASMVFAKKIIFACAPLAYFTHHKGISLVFEAHLIIFRDLHIQCRGF